jgi:hypothetical protein
MVAYDRGMTTTQAPESLRRQAAEADARAFESFERCDTDGYLSQWASQVTARELRAKADLAEAGGRWEFPALFNLDGEQVPAKLVQTRYGLSWMLLDAEGRCAGWFNRSKAQDEAKAKAANERKGYRIGRVRADAVVVMEEGGAWQLYPVIVPRSRDDVAFGRNVEIVDNGR